MDSNDESLEAPPPLWQGIFLSLGIYSLSIILHAVLPGTVVTGYACSDHDTSNNKNSRRLSYKLNGLVVTVVSLALLMAIPIPFLLQADDSNKTKTTTRSFDSNNNMTLSSLCLEAFSIYNRHRWGLMVGSSLWGVLFSVAFYKRGYDWCRKHDFVTQEPLRCSTDDNESSFASGRHSTMTSARQQRQRSLFSFGSFFRGIGEFNPRISLFSTDVDIKMWLYLAGTLMLELQVLSVAATHMLLLQQQNDNEGGDLQTTSRAVAISGLLWTWFCMDYLSDEHIHLYTYDIFAERIGLKLGWGCLFVYPFLYPLGQSVFIDEHTKTFSDHDEDLSWTMTLGVFCIFLFGWSLTRGANYQKYMFKIHPEQEYILGGWISQTSVMVIPPPQVPEKNGNNTRDETAGDSTTPRPRRLLVSGFWGLARHVNYLGEIIQGFALGLPGLIVTQSPMIISMAYFVIITAILVPRERDDDKLCRSKYGDQAWDAYSQLVPYRIIPGVY